MHEVQQMAETAGGDARGPPKPARILGMSDARTPLDGRPILLTHV